MVQGLHKAGIDAQRLADALPASTFVALDGTLTGDALAEAVAERYPSYGRDLGWLFLDEPIHDAERTWVLSKRWGANTEHTLERLAGLAPPGAVPILSRHSLLPTSARW